ncbi:MAG: sialidase family protein [Acidobacteriota bacterium]
MISLIFAALSIAAVHLGPMAPDAPAREPQLAVRGSNVFLAFGAGDTIYFSASSDSGKTFSAPVSVANAPILPLTRHRGPRLAISGKAIVITAVTGKTAAQGAHAHGLPSDGDLLAWRSLDGGKTWSKGARVNDVPGAPTEGLHALASDAGGRLFAAWLDKRSGQGTKLYGARSADGGVSWSKNILIYDSPDGTICECCHPSAAFDGGDVLVMWRNALAGSRDMYLARSKDGNSFGKPARMGEGTWQLNACPMDGGGLVMSDHRIITAWRRNKEIYFASPGEKETGVGEGTDVALAAGPAGVYAIWSSATGVRALLPGKNESVVVAPRGTFPNIAVFAGGGVLGAWEADGKIVVQAIP